MSWYKVTLITQNLTGGVTHYTSCYTAEIAQITRKNTRFMAYLIQGCCVFQKISFQTHASFLRSV